MPRSPDLAIFLLTKTTMTTITLPLAHARGVLDSLERGMLEWNNGTVEWWNAKLTTLIPTYCACAILPVSVTALGIRLILSGYRSALYTPDG